MPQPNDPSTHDDLIEINITLSAQASGTATLTTILVLQDDVTPGGGRYASYSSPAEVAADVTAGNLNATSQAIADKMFGQNNPPDTILFGQVDLTGSAETAATALDAVIAAGAQFYGVLYESRTVARQIALSTDIEAKADNGTFLLLGLQDDDADWKTTGLPAAWSAVSGFERTVMYYHDDNDADATSDRLDACSMADRLSWDPDETSSGWNHTVTEVDALAAALNQTQKEFLRSNNANVALPMGTRTSTYVDPGTNLAGRPVDHIVSADWFRARSAEAVADLLTAVSERGSKITVDAAGQALVGGEIEKVFIQGVAAGHFLDYRLTPLEVTTADITARRVRFDGSAQLASGVRQVQINLFFDTDPIA